MKKLFLLLLAIVVIAGCKKDEVTNPEKDIWNGYEHLKYSTMTVDLIAKSWAWNWKCHAVYTVVGTVDYTFTDDAHFEVTYNLTDGWEMMRSYMYAGDYDQMPTGRWNWPRVWQFPNQAQHNPYVTNFTYSMPVADLPPGETGFVIATYTKVKKGCTVRRAWGDGDRRFTCRGWGRYTSNFYEEAMDIVVLYGISETTDGNLVLTHINGSSGMSEVILEENVATNGSVSGAAYDESSGYLYFAVDNQLFVNDLNSDTISDVVGTLQGLPDQGTFMDDNYYYYNLDPSQSYGEIIETTIIYDQTLGEWQTTENSISSSVDGFMQSVNVVDFEVTDLASNNGMLYLIGTDHNNTPADETDDNVWLVSYNETDGFAKSADPVPINGDAQIAFGADGLLYAIHTENGEPQISLMDPETGDTGPIDEGGDDLLVVGEGSDEVVTEFIGGEVR